MLQSGIGCLVCTNNIVFDSLIRACFHKRNVLMCCSVINDIRLVFFKNVIDTSAITNRADKRHKIEFTAIFTFKLLLYFISIVFINVKYDKLFRLMTCYLSAKLASDRATATCYQYGLTLKVLEYLVHVYSDRLSSKQILDRNRLHLAEKHLTICYLINARKLFHLTACFLTNIKDIPFVLR